MTWKETKEEVDRQLKEKGIAQDVDVFWLDTHMPCKAENLDVDLDKDLGITVSSF